MAKLNVGDKFPEIEVETLQKGKVAVKDLIGGKKTVFVFLRYLGCSLCQLDIAELAEGYDDIAKTGGQAVVVLQSPVSTLEKENVSVPFTVIADPDQTIYKLLDIKPAASKENMGGPKAMAKIDKVKARGYQHGAYEGEELQLPAAFGVDGDMKVFYAHYATEVGDTPDAEEIAKLVA